MITVLHAGASTTVQDLGRPGYAHLGVSSAGAADPVSLRIGNRLVGNADGTAALELTLVGGAFRFDSPRTIALTGSDFGALIESRAGIRRSLSPWERVSVDSGAVLHVGATRSGARAYICVAGGIATVPVLGSRSTHVATGLGGVDGGRVRTGQNLPLGKPPARAPGDLRVSASELVAIVTRRTLRCTSGPQSELFPPDEVECFHATSWEVSESADRSGLRLIGPALALPRKGATQTEGVCAGSVQVPGDGRPIVLFTDQQTTGGYPKIATVIAADLPAVGQLRPRDRIRFERVGLAAARELLLAQERLLQQALPPA